MQSILIDAGPLIALFSVSDKHHQHYDALISTFSADGLRLLTTWPCIVELGGVIVYPFAAENLESVIASMKTYTETAKREMKVKGTEAFK